MVKEDDVKAEKKNLQNFPDDVVKGYFNRPKPIPAYADFTLCKQNKVYRKKVVTRET